MNNKGPVLDNGFYKSILESLEDYGVFTTDTRGIITTWNKGAEHVLGYSEEEICGKSAVVIFTDEDRNNGVPDFEFTEALEKGRGLDERYHQKKDGSLFWASGLVFPLYDVENNHIGFTKILRNLSNRKQAEGEVLEARRYAQSIVETSKEPILVLNPDLTVSTASNAFYKLFSFQKPEVENNNFFMVLETKLDTEPLKDQMQKLDSFENIELIYKRKEQNDERILIVSIRKVFPTSISIGQQLMTFEDITFQRKLELAKDEFIGIASHELKTPITSLTVALQLIEKKTAETEEFRPLYFLAQKASRQVIKLTELVKDLLDVTKIQSGKLELVKTDFLIREMIEEYAQDIQSTVNTHHIVVIGGENIRIQADKNRLGQVITNFLFNAIKYSPENNEIQIKISRSDKGCKIAVRDYGIGIEKEKIPFIFDRFFRVEATAQNYAGLGLGLYISSEIISQHKGEIGIESEVGVGSTFWFTIPNEV